MSSRVQYGLGQARTSRKFWCADRYELPSLPIALETFTITFNHLKESSALLELAWEKTLVPVKIEVLAPNHRPIQVTDDLTSFWREMYPKVKAELSRRYPRHEWR